MVTGFMAAVKKATDFVLTEPEKAYTEYVDMKPIMGTTLNRKIFERSFAYFSKDLQNVKRDWVGIHKVSPLIITTDTAQTKVTNYGKRLGVLAQGYEPNYTNDFLQWSLEGESKDPLGDQKRMASHQTAIAERGGCRRCEAPAQVKVVS